MRKYCTYQERSQKEVKERLAKESYFGNEAEQIIAQLVLEGFINEQRFTEQFVGGKFRTKSWGKLKIKNELKKKGIYHKMIDKSLEQMDEKDYQLALQNLLLKKKELLTAKVSDIYLMKSKLYSYAIQKGYESQLILSVLQEILHND